MIQYRQRKFYGRWLFPNVRWWCLCTITLGERSQPTVSVFQALSLMLLFGTFLLTLLSYIDNHRK
ncbi:putative holin-like toxin [Limosilactobacillus ingluviei]|uniref:putative holin-like toxin n=1 Tax=Limosilactobacillus ingluviei TaxID=148604 RepID=UPI0030B8F8B7